MNQKKKIKFGLYMLAVVTMITTIALQVQAAVVYNEVVPYDWDTINPCTGENIHLSGNIHMKNTDTKDASGGDKLTMHQNYQDVSGISIGNASETKYQAQGSENIEFISQKGTTGIYKGTKIVKLVGKGSGDNFALHLVAFAIVNADGTMTISFEKDRTECLG